MDSKSHIDLVMEKRILPIFEKAAARIEALKAGEKIPATELAKDIGKEMGMTGPQLYPTLKLLLDDYPGVDVRKGAHGGIVKLAAVVAAPVVTTVVTDDSTEKV